MREILSVAPGPLQPTLVRQTSACPVLLGPDPDAPDWACGNCGAILISKVPAGRLFDFDIQCFSCSKHSRVRPLPLGRPLGTKVCALLPGTCEVSEPVNLSGDVVVAGEAALHRRELEREIRAAPMRRPRRLDVSAETLTSLLRRADTMPWLGAVLAADQRGRQSKTPPRTRHRLAQLVVGVRAASEAIESGSRAMNVLSVMELNLIVELFEAWDEDPAWPEMVKSLRDPGEFQHAVVTVGAGTCLIAQGNDAAIPPKEAGRRISDLIVATTAGTALAVEVKAPPSLQSRGTPIDLNQALSVVENAVRSAGTGPTGQLRPDRPGFLMVGGFHLATAEMRHLEEASASSLRRRQADHVLGVGVVSLGVRASNITVVRGGFWIAPGATMESIIEIGLARNPRYARATEMVTVDSRLRRLHDDDGEVTIGGQPTGP